MAENTTGSLSDTINDLAQTISQNADNIADKIADMAIDKKLREGTITFNEAMKKRVFNYSGDLVTCFCTYCGKALQLHEKMNSGYCDRCGENVVLHDALNCRFTDEALKRMSGDELYKAGTYYENFPHKKTLEAAAKRNHSEAKILLTKIYFLESKYYLAKKYSKGVSDKLEDMKFCSVFCKAYGKDIENKDALGKLKALNKSNFRFEELKNVFDEKVRYIKSCVEEEERARNRREAERFSYASTYTPTYSSSSSVGIPDTWSSNPARDFRTGERLYRNENGDIVNIKGDIVPIAWQE